MARRKWWTSKRLNLRRQAHVNAAPDRVFVAIADVRARPSWMPELHSVEAPDRPVTTGDRFRGESRLLLHQFLGESVVLNAESPTHLEEEVVIGARFRTSWSIEPSGDGATITYDIRLDYPGGPLGRIERALLGWRLGAMQRRSLERIAERLRTETG